MVDLILHFIKDDSRVSRAGSACGDRAPVEQIEVEPSGKRLSIKASLPAAG
jgi:hypothetical protein